MLRLFKKSLQTGIVTTAYPELRDNPSPGFRGLPERREEPCRQCHRCMDVCPTQAITFKSQESRLRIQNSGVRSQNSGVSRPEFEDGNRNFAIAEGVLQEESHEVTKSLSQHDSEGAVPETTYWSIDPKKCIFCGYCADNCPGRALDMGNQFELAENSSSGIPEIYGGSIHIRHLDAGSCNGCDWEMTTLTGPVYDTQRLGFDFVASPRHADILMVTGPVTRNLEIAARKTYSATPSPKLVLAAGTCACSGGICGKSYASSGGVNNILPVDVYIPGCPPRPQALIQGLLQAVDRWKEKD